MTEILLICLAAGAIGLMLMATALYFMVTR
jgi:hypothetical protein